MNSALINLKTDPKVKKQAQKVASDLGFSLSSLINAYLRDLIKTKTVCFSLSKKERPSQWLLNSIKEAKKDIENDRVSPSFDNAKEAISYLDRVIKQDES